MEIYTPLVALFLVLLQIGAVFTIPIADANDLVDSETNSDRLKRGGGRAFYGFYNSAGSKRDDGSLPYFLYQKRGGGRAFSKNGGDYYGFDKRAGGRAFAGSWSPYLERFNDYKRSYPIYYSDNFYY